MPESENAAPAQPPPPHANDSSPGIGAICASLAKAQATFEDIKRTRTVRVSIAGGGAYSFNYAPLDVVLSAVRKALAENGLSVTQSLKGGAGAPLTVRTLLMHSSGEWLGSSLSHPMPGRAQEVGSAITYLRRYALVSLLGVASEEDDDGNAADGNHVEPGKGRARAKVDLPGSGAPDLGSAKVAPAPAAAPRERADDGTISDAQRKRLWAIAHEREKVVGTPAKTIVERVMEYEQIPVGDDGKRIITRSKYDALVKAVETYTPEPGDGG